MNTFTNNKERDYEVEKFGKEFIMFEKDLVGCNEYLLDGYFSYNEVVDLNKLTGKFCCFGYCKKLGHIAFIGVLNQFFLSSGYFQHVVHEYGTSLDESEYYFEKYSDEYAKRIEKYMVYGSEGIKYVISKAKLSKLKYIYDSRYLRKHIFRSYLSNILLEMDVKFAGLYSYKQSIEISKAKKLSKYSLDTYPIKFGVIDEKYPVGIINIWSTCEDNWLFKDVWCYGANEPKIQRLCFIDEDEAKKHSNYSLYIYDFSIGLNPRFPQVEKIDRTFDKRFVFQLPYGNDYRLI